jgi:hypothetical protein
MPDPTTPTRATASAIVVALAIASLTTAGASAGVATLLTGSPSPSMWVQAYEHANECRQAGAENDPNCSAGAAEALTKLRIAAELESKAKGLALAGKSPITRPVSRRVARPSPEPRLSAPVQAPRPPTDEIEPLDG